MPPRSRGERVRTDAFVVRRTVVGDADLLLGLFTATHGLVTASARSARRASSKLGALEPLHTLHVELELSSRSDIVRLCDAKIVEPRVRLLGDGPRLEAASRLLRWTRGLVSREGPEPRAFEALRAALGALDAGASPDVVGIVAGLELLGALGYELELERCVRCARPCPGGSAAYVDPAAGGLVCRACGGAASIMSGAVRRALHAGGLDGVSALGSDDRTAALRLVEQALAAHAPQGERSEPSPRSTRR